MKLMPKILKTGNNLPLLLVLTVWALYKLPLSLQGFDLCDEGWVMSGYQQIYRDPSSIEYLFLCYNAQLAGGLWNLLFSDLGYWGFRLCSIVIEMICVAVVFSTLAKYVNKVALSIGFLICMLSGSGSIIVFHHNHLTQLFTCISLCILFYSTYHSKPWMTVLGFFVIGINVFTRLPNVTLLGFGVIFIVQFIYDRSWKNLFLSIAMAISGFLIGILLEYLLIHLLGHTLIFNDALSGLHSAANSSDSTHNIGRIVRTYLGDYMVITIYLCFYASIAGGFYLIKRFTKKKWYKVIMMLFAFAGWILVYKKGGTIYGLYSLSTIILLYAIYVYKENRAVVFLSVLSLANLYLQPLGSDFGIGNMGSFSIMVAVPWACCMFYELMKNGILETGRKPIIYTALLFLSAFIPKQLYKVSTGCYFDDGSRFVKRYRVNHPLATTYTTEIKSRIMDELLHELNNYVKKGDYLLCFQNLPTIHYLTETRSYVNNPWVWTYDSDNFEFQLHKAYSSHSELPVIVREKVKLPGSDWTDYYPDYDNENMENTFMYKRKRVRVMNQFIHQHHYQLLWENEQFQILGINKPF